MKLRKYVLAASVVVPLLALVGPSLAGQRVFHASDLLERHAPWAFAEPHWGKVTNPLVSDTVDGVGPTVVLAQQRVFSGDVAPLWNGFVMGGRPLTAVPNDAGYSPFSIPHTLLPTWYAFGLRKALELIAAVGFTFLFLRRIGLGRYAALIGGLVYAYSGFQVVWTNWSQARIGALIPALFWAVERVVQEPRARSAIPLAVVTAVMWLEGFPAITVWAIVFAAVYGVVRTWSRSVPESRPALAIGLAGVVLGTCLAAFQLLPFASVLDDVDIESREQHPVSTLARRTLATSAVPDAFGNPARGPYYGPSDYQTYGPVNYVENSAFIGIAALGMVGMAAAYGASVADRRRRVYLWGGVGLCVALIYMGGLPLRVVEAIPFLGSSHIGRLRSVMLFLLAVLAAIGVEAAVRGDPARRPQWRRLVAAYAIMAALLAAGLYQAGRMAADAGQTAFLRGELLVAGIVGVVVLVCVLLLHSRRAHIALLVLPAVIAFEVVRFAGAWWPQLPVELFYPRTPTEEFLIEAVDGERIAVTDRTLLPNVPTISGLRTVTAHAFSFPEWRQMLQAADPGVFRLSATYLTLAHEEWVVTSPVLDRLAARYLVVDPRRQVFGEEVAGPEATGSLAVSEGEVIEVPWEPGTRALVFEIPEGHLPGSAPDELMVEVVGPSGELASGTRILPTPLGAGRLTVAVPEPVGWDPVSLRVSALGDTAITIGVTDDGDPAVGRVLAVDDGLRVVYAADTVIYERTRALSRIRWAASSSVIVDPQERLDALAVGVHPDLVVLDEGTAGFGSSTAQIERVLDDGGDRVIVDVVVDGPGYLVIADSMQTWWEVQVDGTPVEPVGADHVGIAIPLEAGSHRVVADVRPPGRRLGLVISGLALAALVYFWVRGRRDGGERESESS